MKDIEIWENDPFEQKDHVVDARDYKGNKLTDFTFEGNPDNTKAGEYITTVTVKDDLGATVTKKAKLIVKPRGTKVTTEEIPFEVEYKYDSNLEDGKFVVDQEGENGIKTITETYNKETKEYDSSEEITKKPVKKIIRIGGKSEGEHTYTEKIPFEYEIKYDPTLESGKYEIDVKGTPGTRTTTWKIENSKVVGEPTVEETKPVNAIIRVGNKEFTGEFEYVDKEIIPFETEVKINPELAPNEIKVITEGENGSKERKVTQAFKNGEKGELVVGEYETTKQPTKKVIEIGSKTNGQYNDTETIPFEVEVRKDPSLKKGEWKYAEVDGVQQKGESGLKERTITIVNSQVTEVSEYKTTREAKNAVILVGDEDFTGEVKHTKDFDIPFEVEVRYNDDLPAGTSKEIQKGEKGSYTIEFKQNIKNGQPDGEMTETELKDKRVEPKKHIIEIGRKVETPENNYSKDVEVEIEYVYDDTKDKGVVETGELIPGKVETKVVDKYNPETGKVEQTVEEVVTKAKQIIVVGTKDLTGKYEYEVTTEIPFEVEVIEDDTLEKGRSVVEQEGKPGNKTTKYEQNIVNGKPEGEAKVLEEKTNEEPIKHIIRVGTKSTEGKVIIESEIPYEVEVVEDSNLEAGKTETRQEGSVGKKVTTVSVEDNKEQSREEVIEKDPVKKIIAIGTKKVCEIPLIPLVPAETKSEEEPKDPETPGEETPREEEPKAPETPGEETPETPREQEPGKPGKENPNKPDNKKPESNNASNPRTGDDGVMYIGAVALIAVVVLLYVSKKKNKNEQ
ncbi:G5 domain-containing protein [Helcococcus kunzii]